MQPNIKKFATALIAPAMAAFAMNSTAQAAIILSDGNAVAEIDPFSSAGHFDWEVDTVDVLEKQWFWVRLGDEGGEFSIDTIASPTYTSFNTNRDLADDRAIITYAGRALTITVDYQLRGGQENSGTSSINELITITNMTDDAMDLSFFQYVDFDLFRDPTLDELSIIGDPRNTAIQSNSLTEEATGSVEETAATPSPNYYQAGSGSTILDALTDASPTTLANIDSASGNVNWAFQWDISLAAYDPNSGADSFVISKIKTVNLDSPDGDVPEPASLALMALGAAAVCRRQRRGDR